MWRRVLPSLLAGVLLVACKTPDGPRFPLPAQDLSAPVPDGLVRVVFFNTSTHALYVDSGPIRIQLDGAQIPSIWLDHYAQVFAEPGMHRLLLEHYDLFMWKSEYTVEFEGPEVLLEVYNHPVSTKFRKVEALPADFHVRFKPGRDPDSW